ncbi:hypothetical protein GOY17_03045 [Lysobacter soli]|uniref:hypothetical protein n=1 Tax=Lysobacter soli TaxID=453783 RepID=UPI0012ECBCE1|nr:hypothetical protein [Lysobacter soli]QGW63984.1 hypothetical protein GOY17_03045 [Lysobacter soli]
MQIFTNEKRDLGFIRPITEDALALQRAENEGLPSLSHRDEASRLFARVSMSLRKGLSSVADGNMLTLEELLGAVNKVTRSDTRLRQQCANLVALLASDIRNAKQFSLDSCLRARPLHEWRQRYNGLDVLR